jgi:hypothetical protein
MQTEENVRKPTPSKFRHVRKMLERRKVRVLTRPENAGTPNCRNSDPFGNIGKPTRSEIRPERKTSGNLDIRKKGAGPIYCPDTKED